MTAASWEQRKTSRQEADRARKETHRKQREAQQQK